MRTRYWRLETRTYNAWRALVERCTNKNHTYFHLYGGAGVTVCERWRKFDNFLEDMGEAIGGAQIDRIDPALGYGPNNCRWATPSQQNTNRRGWCASGFKGVYQRPSGRFAAVLNHKGKTRTVGTFDTAIEAAVAFDQEAESLYGEFAMTNKRMGLLTAYAGRDELDEVVDKILGFVKP